MRRMALLLCASLFLTVLTAPASPSTGETVNYPSGHETVSGYLVLPKGEGPHPALVLIHEWWGLNEWVKEQADKFAGEGYVALAVDLYRGKVATGPDEAHELTRGMPQDRAVRDLKAAFAYLASRKDVNKNRIGSIGGRMGGGLSLQLAVNEPELAACVVNYGSMPTDPADIQKSRRPFWEASVPMTGASGPNPWKRLKRHRGLHTNQLT